MKESWKLFLITLAAVVVQALLLNLGTAHFCPEYFSQADTDPSATAEQLAVQDGVLLAVVFGLPLAVLGVAAARLGKRPPLAASTAFPPLVGMLGGSLVVALLVGWGGMTIAEGGLVVLDADLAGRVARERQPVYLGASWAYDFGRSTAFFAGLAWVAWAWLVRGRLAKVETPLPRSEP